MISSLLSWEYPLYIFFFQLHISSEYELCVFLQQFQESSRMLLIKLFPYFVLFSIFKLIGKNFQSFDESLRVLLDEFSSSFIVVTALLSHELVQITSFLSFGSLRITFLSIKLIMYSPLLCTTQSFFTKYTTPLLLVLRLLLFVRTLKSRHDAFIYRIRQHYFLPSYLPNHDTFKRWLDLFFCHFFWRILVSFSRLPISKYFGSFTYHFLQRMIIPFLMIWL